MEDRDIILLLKSRPSDGLYQAIGKYGGLVKVVVARVLGNNEQDVEECVADTFINVWKTIDRLNADSGSLKGYILCTARNTAINRYHKLKRRQVISLDELEIAGEDDVALTVLGEEKTMQLQSLILEMEKPDQEIFIRKYFLFESVKDIARRLGLDEIQVKNRLYRGRQKLRRKLEERGYSNAAI